VPQQTAAVLLTEQQFTVICSTFLSAKQLGYHVSLPNARASSVRRYPQLGFSKTNGGASRCNSPISNTRRRENSTPAPGDHLMLVTINMRRSGPTGLGCARGISYMEPGTNGAICI
jgi:hypothetical protein